MNLAWHPREPPLAAQAAFAEGIVALSLIRRLLATPGQLAKLNCVGDRRQLCVLGRTEDLPWVEGLVYLAPEPGRPELWLPCSLRPALDPSLLLRLLPTLGLSPPLAVLPNPEPRRSLGLSLAEAREVAPDELRAFHEHLKAQL